MKALLVIGGSVTAMGGLSTFLLFSFFSLMFVPVCPHFALDAANADCRQPLYGIYGGLGIAAIGVAMMIAALVVVIVRRVRR